MKANYSGSCHCGAVVYKASLDLKAASKRCNCSFCRKTRYWKAFVYGDDFTLVKGSEYLADYQANPSSWPEGHVHHYFCRLCGVRAFSKGYLDMEPFNGEFHAINLTTLDDVSDEELAAIPIDYEDGRADKWQQAPTVSSYL